ncbi:GntR family transcriptional regulator [Mesobacillus foraminis]|uniref:GntR family transcriptional regulator n=1 Tax=Mesobacillus foraminis TaxID=279826 RepID=UPI000EF4BDF4|nr:GntR family transcriptional regulator [Mesobacillus foraminis]
MSKRIIPKVQKQTAVKQAIEYLRKFILESNEPGQSKLPSEAQLAAELGISRLTVREALTVLENEGFITRSQGSSSTITTFARKLTEKIDHAGELKKFIKDCGYEVLVDKVSYSWEKSNQEQAEALKIEPGEDLLIVKKRFCADTNPAVYCINRIPRVFVNKKTFTDEEIGENIFSFVEENNNFYFSHDLMELVPSVANGQIAQMLNLEVNTPLLRIDITKYTDKGIPVMYNTEYYVHDLIKFTASRTITHH